MIPTHSGGTQAGPPAIRATVIVALLCAVSLLLFVSSPGAAQAATCPNESIRIEQGPAALALPDCRAYELVSPGSTPSVTKESMIEVGGKASANGDALSYISRYPAGNAISSGTTWLSRRAADGWVVSSVGPQMTPTSSKATACEPGVAFSEELNSFVLVAGGKLTLERPEELNGECGKPAEELVAGEPRGYSNLYLQKEGQPYTLVNSVPSGVLPGNATFQAASADLSRVVFSENAALTPEALAGFNLYEWSEEGVRLIGVLPSGQSVPATLSAGIENWQVGGGGLETGLAPVSHAVSKDGERVFFQANGNLYVRENAGQPSAVNSSCINNSEPENACTLEVDETKGSGASGGGVFQFASSDGEVVFFTSDHKLTANSTATAGNPDLYEYRVASRKLADRTVAAVGQADVQGISGGSDDGAYVYFVARGALTGSEQNAQGETAVPGEPNLYLYHEGALKYVVTLAPWSTVSGGGADRQVWWNPARILFKTAWSASGRYLLFPSLKPLTGYDNTQQSGKGKFPCIGGVCEELYLYDAAAGTLRCVSCGSEGTRPYANTSVTPRIDFHRYSGGPRFAPRQVSDTGRVYFETENPLLPADVNDAQDVYEYDEGTLTLISGGGGQGGSAFVDASADGSDVFFVSSQALVGSDTDGGLPSVYDARVDGGFAEPPPPAAACSAEASCRPSTQSQPAGPTASTATFGGEGNALPSHKCKRGQVRRQGRCVKKKKGHPSGGKAHSGKKAQGKNAQGKKTLGRKRQTGGTN